MWAFEHVKRILINDLFEKFWKHFINIRKKYGKVSHVVCSESGCSLLNSGLSEVDLWMCKFIILQFALTMLMVVGEIPTLIDWKSCLLRTSKVFLKFGDHGLLQLFYIHLGTSTVFGWGKNINGQQYLLLLNWTDMYVFNLVRFLARWFYYQTTEITDCMSYLFSFAYIQKKK